MQKYKDKDNDSGIVAYEIGDDYIRVEYESGDIFTYNYEKAGKQRVEKMKELAKKGEGLNAYIYKYIIPIYKDD